MKFIICGIINKVTRKFIVTWDFPISPPDRDILPFPQIRLIELERHDNQSEISQNCQLFL